MIESRTPTWKRGHDLRLTRIKDPNRGQILIFKHLEWQTLRFEAKAESNIVQTPLRLIANQASCRITIKKKLSDCSVLGARIMLIFDDLLWVLTDAQLLSALHFADYLGELIKKAPLNKQLNEELIIHSHSQSNTSLKNVSSAQSTQSAVSRLFSQYDITETSHHIFVSRIEIHLCDDNSGPNNSRSQHPSLEDGGALQITASKLLIDVYPYQKVMDNRNHWLRYSDPSSSRSEWIEQHLNSFSEKINKKRSLSSAGIKPSIRSQTRSILSLLMSRVILIRIGDYSVSCVTTNKTSKLKLNEKLVSTDKSAPLPDDMMAFYMEINNYYFFDSNETVPNSTAFIHLAPLKVFFDPTTLLWMNAFQANLHNAMVKLQELIPKQEKQKLNTKIECLMPLICFKCPDFYEYSTLEIKSARIIASNCETEASSFEELNSLMVEMGNSPFIYERESFPWLKCDLKPISDEFFKNISQLMSDSEELGELWTVKMEPLWAEFRVRNTNKFKPLLDPLPVTLWAYESAPQSKSSDNSPDLNLLLCISSVIKVQISHNQYLFLMRFLEELSEFTAQMNSDTILIQKNDLTDNKSIFTSISLITAIPKIELILILDEEFQTSRSIGLSPQHSVIDISPSVDERISVHSDMATLAVKNEDNRDSTFMPKSHSDSLLNGSTTSFDTNKSQTSETLTNQEYGHNYHSSASISTIPLHNKLQNASMISFKKEKHNFEISNFNSNSTLNESGLADSYPIDDDNRSIRSDLSADSEQFVVVGFETMTQEEEDIFAIGRIETADEVKEDSNADTPSEDSSNVSETSSDIPVSVTSLQIKLSNLTLVQQSLGFHSKIFMRCSNILLSEFIKMPFSEYQAFINQRISIKDQNRLSTEMNPSENPSSVCARIEAFAKPNTKDELISLVVSNIDCTLHKDTVLQLADFITDEEMAYVPPTNILLNKLCFTLIDDKVSAPPLSLNIPYCLIERDKSNQLKVSPLSQSMTTFSIKLSII